MKEKKETPKDIIKKALWYRGYKVRDVSNTGIGYDLLVEGKYKLKALGKTTGAVIVRNCDVIAVVDGKSKKYAKSKEKHEHGNVFNVWENNPLKIMGRPASR